VEERADWGGGAVTALVRYDAAWIADALNRADAILAAPPARSHIERVRPKGALVRRFVLPLRLCQPQNRTRLAQKWALGKLKNELNLVMRAQCRPWKVPLPGRPFVRCVRFSNTEPDKYSDWAKQAVDRLCQSTKRRKDGLGILRDDRPSDVDLHQEWNYVKRGEGFCLVEVFTGEVAPDTGGKAA
jgi:hypothetical protein